MYAYFLLDSEHFSIPFFPTQRRIQGDNDWKIEMKPSLNP